MDKQLLWWNYVSGAARYLNDCLSAAAECRVLLVEEMPFMDTFLQQLQEKLHQRDTGLRIDVTYAVEWPADIGEALMNRCAPQADYHPLDGPRPAYIAKQGLLDGCVLVIREIEGRPEWLETAVEYGKHSSARGGLLVLTYSGDCPLSSPRRGVAALRRGDYITSYDMQLYASYCVADEPGIPPAERHYVTQIASRMSGTDPGLCGALAVRDVAADPRALLERLAEEGYAAAADMAADEDFIASVLWEAQIRTVFPIVEQSRRRFIEAYSDGLRRVLPQRDEFGKQLEEPQDMEIRHMWYYYFKSEGFRSPEDEQAFRLLYDVRNRLAHLNPLDSATVFAVFALDEQRSGSAV